MQVALQFSETFYIQIAEKRNRSESLFTELCT